LLQASNISITFVSKNDTQDNKLIISLASKLTVQKQSTPNLQLRSKLLAQMRFLTEIKFPDFGNLVNSGS